MHLGLARAQLLPRSDGYPFRNNEHAVLIATGITHHIVLLKD